MDEAFYFPGIILLCMLLHPKIGLTTARYRNLARAVISHKRRGLWSREFGITVKELAALLVMQSQNNVSSEG